MKNQLLSFLVIGLTGLNVFAQNQDKGDIFSLAKAPESYLFSVSTLTQEDVKWSFDYLSSYGDRVETPFGFDGVSQQLGVKGLIGKQFTVVANIALGFSPENNVSSSQQAEIIYNFLGGKKNEGFRMGAGLGYRKDFNDINSMLSRATFAYEASRFKAVGNLLFEKAFAHNRDAIDIITSLGFHYRITGNFYGGLEAIGEDLEGFWDEEEAEGGAKLMAGPSLNLVPKDSRFSFSLSGGPVIYATQNQNINPEAIRELPAQSGLLIRAKVTFLIL